MLTDLITCINVTLFPKRIEHIKLRIKKVATIWPHPQ